MKFDVKIKGVGALQKQIQTASENARKVCEQEVQAAGQDWVAGAVKDAPVDQAALKAAISYKQSDTHTSGSSLISVEIVAQKFYAPFMEFGTKGKYQAIPGTEEIASQFKNYKGGDFGEMIRMLERWVARKGITGRFSVKTRRRVGSKAVQANENRSAAFAIAMHILKHGIKPHPFFFKQGDVVWPNLVKRMQSALERETKVSVIMPGSISRPQIKTI